MMNAKKFTRSFILMQSKHLKADQKLCTLVKHVGMFGVRVSDVQDACRVQAPVMRGNEHEKIPLHVELEKTQQLKALELKPWILWQTIFKNSFPWLSNIAVRVLTMAMQSADVERICKVHKLVHTRIRNRLANEAVYMSMYYYVNLRVLKRLDIAVEDNVLHLEGFLADALDADSDENGDGDKENAVVND
jgi:hAT family C-terminal dimerisation region